MVRRTPSTLSRNVPGFEDLVRQLNAMDGDETLNDSQSVYSDDFNNIADKVFVKVLEKTPSETKQPMHRSISDIQEELADLRNAPESSVDEGQELDSADVHDAIENAEIPLHCDQYGIVNFKDTTSKSELLRVKKWEKMRRTLTKEKDSLVHSSFSWSSKFMPRVRKGVPHQWRGAAWSELVAIHSGLYAQMKIEAIRGLEDRLLDVYWKIRDQPTPVDDLIDYAVNHTMRYHTMYYESGSGREMLEHLTTAVVLYHQDIVFDLTLVSWLALLLTVTSDDVAFLIAVHLLSKPQITSDKTFHVSRLYSHPIERARFHYIHDHLLESLAPQLKKHLQNQNVQPKDYCDQWFQSLFVTCFNPPLYQQEKGWTGLLPFSAILRLWDLFTAYGFGIMIVASVALLDLYKNQLSKLEREDILASLSSVNQSDAIPKTIDCDQFIKHVLKLYEVSLFKPEKEIIPRKRLERRNSLTGIHRLYALKDSGFSHSTPSLNRNTKKQKSDVTDELFLLADAKALWPSMQVHVEPIKQKRYKGVDLVAKLDRQFTQFVEYVGFELVN
ncbi:hypothetical protein EDD86DRAFT_211151 [Gorgonomyces haynaldii]|nr:hypothetical protein EDD86DRAFT_211151 [Gorgonomyces haynaldii]